MNYKQLYIGVTREVHKYKNDYELTSADIAYWLTKAVNALIDEKYNSLDTIEKIKRELWYLYDEASVAATPGTTTLSETAIGYDIDLSSTDIRYITNERATISYSGSTRDVAVKAIQLDKLNEKIENPFSEHIVHLNRMKPLKIDKDNGVMLITDGNYSITYYKVKFIKNPIAFTIANATSTVDYTELPESLHHELVTKAARMILENETDPRYQSIINEENKLN